MKQVSVAEFRNTFRELTEPTEVRKYKDIVGAWFPGTSYVERFVDRASGLLDEQEDAYRTEIEVLQEEVKRLKRLLAETNKVGLSAVVEADPFLGDRAGFGRSYPAPKPGTKKK